MNAAIQTCCAAKPLLYCTGCDRWHHGDGHYASLPVYIPHEGFLYELCPACHERVVAAAAERQRMDLELQLYAFRRRQ